MRKFLTASMVILTVTAYTQTALYTDSLRVAYRLAQKTASNQFARAYYPNRANIYSRQEKVFMATIDSLKAPFHQALSGYRKQQPADSGFLAREQRDIDYFFDRMILDYPYFHHNHTGKRVILSVTVQQKLDQHLADFNDPALLSGSDVRDYIEAYLRHQASAEVKKPVYKRSDNKRLDVYLALIPGYFTNQACKDYWQYHFLSDHLENWGTKHVDRAVKTFMATCKNEKYRKQIDSVYTAGLQENSGHLVRIYKTVDDYQLDLHLFLPDSSKAAGKRPVIVYFSGGSWTQGNPSWAFYSCSDYASKGWVAVSVEYRLADRHETTPFEAVKDARSAIRWLRMHAQEYRIDTGRIVVSGNSAGGHLALATALSTACNEETDDLRVNAAPNLILVNAGVYDLYAENATDWIARDLADKSLVKQISPQHLARKGLPPLLIVHGTADRSVGYATAQTFAQTLKQLGNEVAFETLEGAPHHIWFDRRYSGKVSALRKAFLQQHGYD